MMSFPSYRIVIPEEAQRLLDTPNSPEGSFDWDYSYTNTYGTNFLDVGPDLAHTVIVRTQQVQELQRVNGDKDRTIRQQAEQIKRLQEGIKELGEWDSKDYVPRLVYLGIIAEKDMEP